MPKYRNKKTVLDGITFDSMREANRWRELCLLQKAGHIRDLERQVSFELAPGVKFAGAKRAQPPLRLIVDFRYTDLKACAVILEDAKGIETQVSRVKRHLLKAQRGLEVRLV
jgi:hypothetical protein